MKRALLAGAAALVITSLAPISAASARRPVPPAPGPLELQCIANADNSFNTPNKLPNAMWYWIGRLVEITDTENDGNGTLIGFSINPANRTIHALVEYNLTSVTYELHCDAMEPGSIPGRAGANPAHSYVTEYEDETGGDGTEIGRPAVCNPAPTKGSGIPTSWKTVPGNSYLLTQSGANCASLAAGIAPTGYLMVDWHSISSMGD